MCLFAFFSQSFTCLVQSCEIIITHHGEKKGQMLKLILISDRFPTNLSPPTTAEALVLRNESASAQIQSGENKDFSSPTQMEAPQEQGRVRGSVFFLWMYL